MLRHMVLVAWLLLVAAGSAFLTWLFINHYRCVILSIGEVFLLHAAAIAWGCFIPGIIVGSRRMVRAVFKD